MRWLLIVLLVSLAALLIVAAGAAYHIWKQRFGRDSEAPVAVDSPEEPDLEVEP